MLVLQRAAGALFIVALSASLRGAPLQNLVTSADAIVVGDVQSRIESGSNTSFQLNVQRVLTGSPPSVVPISHDWGTTGSLSVPEAVAFQAYGIWFLKHNPVSGSWDVLRAQAKGKNLFASLYYPLSPAAATSITVQGPPNTVVEPLAMALIQSAVNASGSPEFVLDALGSTDSPAVRTALRDLLANGSSRSRAVAMAALLVRGDDGAAASLESVWPTISGVAEVADVVAALRDYYRSTTSQGIGALIGIAQSAAVPAAVRQAAVWALKSIHTQGTLPFLASLLDSDDGSLRLAGAIGIAAFVNGCPAQGPSNMPSLAFLKCAGTQWATAETKAHFIFKASTPADEAAQEAFWKTWWLANQAAIVPH